MFRLRECHLDRPCFAGNGSDASLARLVPSHSAAVSLRHSLRILHNAHSGLYNFL